MIAGDFRNLAGSFPEAIEPAHRHHPDFRVRGKIFATLGYPDKHWAVVKLTPDERERFIQSDRDVQEVFLSALFCLLSAWQEGAVAS